MAISLREVDAVQHQALMRLTLLAMGETHRLIGEFQAWLTGLVVRTADDAGNANGVGLIQTMPQIENHWRQTTQRWVRLFEAAREQAASLPFGALVVKHNAFVGDGIRLQETMSAEDVGAIVQLWQQRRRLALQATQTRIYGDGLNLSQRIWRLENGGLTSIRNTLATAMAERTSAVALARRVEAQLGADADMPRWTRDRLYKLTSAERSRDRTGLLAGSENRSRGIAYNALRLARTELQFANHAVTTEIAKHSPWVTGRYVVLSPAHPKIDICDSYAAGGPYPVDDEILPLHPNCVTPGQLVATKRGKIPIEEVQAGDMVLTHQGRYNSVTEAWSRNHSGLVYEIKTDRGQFEVTGNHPVLLRCGWVEAQFVQPGDEVLYAVSDIVSDLSFGVANDMPTAPGKPSVPPGVMLGLRSMPPAVAFNGDLDGRQGEVNEVSPDLVFPLVDKAGMVQRGDHGGFGRRWVGESVFSPGEQHGQEARIMTLLGDGDLLGHFGAFRGILPIRPSMSNIRLLHGFAGFLGAGSIVFGPCNPDGFASSAHGDVVHRQEFAQPPVSQAIAPENFGGFQLLDDVDVVKELRCGPLVFGLNEEGVEFSTSQAVLSEVCASDTFHFKAAHGANNHDDLLSSSPVFQWGAESGNPVVSGIASPAQALMNYTTVRVIRQRHYTGPVYNMEVENDHSYTVNGAAVHNCLCHYKEALMAPATFTNQVRGWLRGENAFLDDYAAWLGTRQVTEPLPWNMSLADSLELWLGTSQGAQAAALRLTGASGETAAQALPVVSPTATGPSGQAVSKALSVPVRGKYSPRYREALAAIDKVHGDGALPEIPVKTQSNMQVFGAYSHYLGGGPKDIAIRGTGDHFELTLTHEVGHFLDHMGIGQPNRFATVAEQDLMAEWRTAIMQSRAVQSLQEKRQNPTAYTAQVTLRSKGGQERTFIASPSPTHLNYLLRQEELWARSYAQYVAVRSENPAMLEQLAHERDDRIYGDRQWEDDDFEPIAEAIDRLFGGLGWRQ